MEKIINVISNIFYENDIECRDEYSKRTISSEDDYTSVFCKLNRDTFKKWSYRFINRKFNKSEESRFGADFIIVFRIYSGCKICFVEAKGPRIKTSPNYNWDKIGINGNSHFSDQLLRQAKWSKMAAIWEMFYNDALPGAPDPTLDLSGSDCVWHQIAFEYCQANGYLKKSWNNRSLLNLLNIRNKVIHRHDDLYGKNIRDMIYKILKCSKGSLISFTDPEDFIVIESNEGDLTAKIPVPNLTNINQGKLLENLDAFMTGYNLKDYLFFDVRNLVDTNNNSA
ncbi:hypothetical protein LEP1GSC050_4102 [Leptospira broomii serovar Hurstbridge str. 5399]|uniref:Uncharacterized protein n=1 Tax=Leptospira broomii serovar Hurstbridge str. 5399 TaxID=1049789 RepID=T0GE58_9LEPT|nr:hypothetical protein [Leptospira broomii]EQA45084.1 hypothetical protein LEP1GSC050_4102 [Leptospira broomii serovar Hurstbridge str. 5399]